MGARALRTSEPANEPGTHFTLHWNILLRNSFCMTPIDRPRNYATPRRVPVHLPLPPPLPPSIPNLTILPSLPKAHLCSLPKHHNLLFLRCEQRPLRQPRLLPLLVRSQLARRRLLRRPAATLHPRNNAASESRIRVSPTGCEQKRA